MALFCFWARRLGDSIAPWYNTNVFMGCVYYCEHYTHISLNTGFAFWRNVRNHLAHCSPWGQGCEDSIDIIARPAGYAFMVSSRARAAHFASNPLQTSLEALFFGVALFCFWARRLGDSIAPWYNTNVFMGCVYYCEHYTHISLNTGFAFWRNVRNHLAHCSPWGQGCEDSIDIIARPAGYAFMVSSRARAAHFASNPLQTSLEALFFGMALFLLLGA